MSAKSASSSSAISTSTRRWPWFWTAIRSCMQSPTNRSRSIDSSFGRKPSAIALRRTKRPRCGAGWLLESGLGRSPATVSTHFERKRVSAAKNPEAAALPSTSPRSAQTQNVDPSWTVRATASGGGAGCQTAVGVEEQHPLQRHRERRLAAGLEQRLDRQLRHDGSVAEAQMRELFVAEVLDHLDQRLVRGRVRPAVP